MKRKNFYPLLPLFSFAAVLALLFNGGGLVHAGGRSANSRVRLEFFQIKRETVEIVDKIIAEFQAANPGIIIEQNNVPDATSVLQTRFAANDAPDIFSGYFTQMEKTLIDEGYVRDLSAEPFMNLVKDSFKESTLYQGRSWMVPISINFMGAVFYNKSFFRQNNISVPVTRAEFYALCDKLKAAGIQPLQVTDKEQWTIGLGNMSLAESMFDPDKVFDVINGSMSIRDIPGFSDYAAWLKKSRQEWTQADYLGTAYEAGLGEFANGKGAMLMMGDWIIPVLQKANPNLDFGVFPFPAANSADTKIRSAIDYTLMIRSNPKSPAHDEAAVKFLKFFTERGAQMWADMGGSISCIKNVKSGLPQYQTITNLIDGGNIFLGDGTNAWPLGSVDQYYIEQQNYLTNFDEKAFYDNLDKMFKSFKE
jgi:raffinose/stachyose/melibiose transport system substrate-binding protein